MVKGRVVSFDRAKGYGFVAPESGGEDVFVHINDLYGEKDLLTTGSIVEFRLEEGGRGPKASAVTVLQPHPEVPTVAAAAVAPSAAAGEEETADVLTAAEYLHEVTEALLRIEPELTSRQIVEIRKRLARIAQEHGWTDG